MDAMTFGYTNTVPRELWNTKGDQSKPYGLEVSRLLEEPTYLILIHASILIRFH